MIEIPNNSIHRIDILVTADDLSVEPDDNPTYIVYDADTNELLTSGSAERDVDNVGSYYVLLGPPLTSIDRILKVEWSYSLNFQQYAGIEYTAISTPYVEIGEIISELGLGTEPQDYNFFPHSKLRVAERIARFQINNYTGREFAQKVGSQVAYSLGSDTILFTERMTDFSKLEQDDIVVYDPANGINDLGYDIELTETGQGIRLKNASQYDVTAYPPSAYMTPPNLKFKDGSRYKIYCTMGYPYIPYQVKQAALLLINDNIYNDSLWRQKYIGEFNTGQMSVTLRDSAFTGTGNLIADNLLDPFKITGIVVI
mgnify:CR=1 FL=1